MLRGRCNSEPAVTVRDPTAASGRLTGWNSQTDGESPDGRQHATAGPVGLAGRHLPSLRPLLASRSACTSPGAQPTGFEHEGRTMAEHSTSDTAMMRRALALAAHGPRADANPRVGCVIVDAAGEVVAAGWHRGAGSPHAEADALAAAGERAAGCTAYVTLEPCNHTGRTPSCAQALVCRRRGPRGLRPERPQPCGGRRRRLAPRPGCRGRGRRSGRTRRRRSTTPGRTGSRRDDLG